MRFESHAKINLYLRVLGRRPDGFHDLETLFAAISVCDIMEFEPIPRGIELRCDDPGVPTDSRNLAWRAAEALAKRAGISRGVRITLRKDVPPGSGLGGGSGNAATTLAALNEFWQAGLSREALWELASGIGSDVPFFLEGGLCVATGRGEILTPLAQVPELWLVLVRPPVSVPTPWAYSALDALAEPPKSGQLSDLTTALDEGPEVIATRLANDFEAAVFPAYPPIAQAKSDLLSAGALGALMSGSGSAVFGIARDEADAEAMACTLAGRYPWVRVARTIRSAIVRID